eukprot:scaffold523_cov446-Prasinococcus_capsulatus_cf.AAC.13
MAFASEASGLKRASAKRSPAAAPSPRCLRVHPSVRPSFRSFIRLSRASAAAAANEDAPWRADVFGSIAAKTRL